MILVTIKSTLTRTKEGVSKSTGRSYSIVEQEGWLDLANGERRIVRFALADKAPPYPVGEYHVGPGSFVVGDFNRLELGRLELVPVAAAVRRAG